MSVLIEGVSVVVKKATIDQKYYGGLNHYRRDCPNQTFCADEHLTRVGFQSPDDALRFAKQLEIRGFVFVKKGRLVEIALVDALQGFIKKCEWLNFSRMRAHVFNSDVNAEISVCWLKGTGFGDLALPPGWNLKGSLSKQLLFIPNDDIYERLEFLREEDGVEVFLDKKTGKTLYLGRPYRGGSEMKMSDDFLTKAVELVQPYLIYANASPKCPEAEEDRRTISEGVFYLKQAAQLNSLNWRAHWYLGKVLQALSDFDGAYKSFKAAYELEPEDPNVCRELMKTCLDLGKTNEGVVIAHTVVDANPNDPEWLANLSLSLLLDTQLDEAREVAMAARKADPADVIPENLLKIISEVRSGKREQPRKFSDLQGV
jgi:tetratricopeptide (TPR) repeat protein